LDKWIETNSHNSHTLTYKEAMYNRMLYHAYFTVIVTVSEQKPIKLLAHDTLRKITWFSLMSHSLDRITNNYQHPGRSDSSLSDLLGVPFELLPAALRKNTSTTSFLNQKYDRNYTLKSIGEFLCSDNSECKLSGINELTLRHQAQDLLRIKKCTDAECLSNDMTAYFWRDDINDPDGILSSSNSLANNNQLHHHHLRETMTTTNSVTKVSQSPNIRRQSHRISKNREQLITTDFFGILWRYNKDLSPVFPGHAVDFTRSDFIRNNYEGLNFRELAAEVSKVGENVSFHLPLLWNRYRLIRMRILSELTSHDLQQSLDRLAFDISGSPGFIINCYHYSNGPNPINQLNRTFVIGEHRKFVLDLPQFPIPSHYTLDLPIGGSAYFVPSIEKRDVSCVLSLGNMGTAPTKSMIHREIKSMTRPLQQSQKQNRHESFSKDILAQSLAEQLDFGLRDAVDAERYKGLFNVKASSWFEMITLNLCLWTCLIVFSWRTTNAYKEKYWMIILNKILIALIFPWTIFCAKLYEWSSNKKRKIHTTQVLLTWYTLTGFLLINIYLTDWFTVLPISGPLCCTVFVVEFLLLNNYFSLRSKIMVTAVCYCTVFGPLIRQVNCLVNCNHYLAKSQHWQVKGCDYRISKQAVLFDTSLIDIKHKVISCLNTWSQTYLYETEDKRLYNLVQYGPQSYQLPQECDLVEMNNRVLTDVIQIENYKMKQMWYLAVNMGSIFLISIFYAMRSDKNNKRLFMNHSYGQLLQKKQLDTLELLMPNNAVEMMLKSKKERHEMAIKINSLNHGKDARSLRVNYDPFSMMTQHVNVCTVVFCDIPDFNKLVMVLKPADIVSILDDTFSEFDRLVDRWAVRKIETVFNTYLFAAWNAGNRDWWNPGSKGQNASADKGINKQAVEIISVVLDHAKTSLKSIKRNMKQGKQSPEISEEKFLELSRKINHFADFVQEAGITLYAFPRIRRIMDDIHKRCVRTDRKHEDYCLTVSSLETICQQYDELHQFDETERYAIRCLICAIQMICYSRERTYYVRNDHLPTTDNDFIIELKLDIRIGMNSGPLVSGIVGRKKPQFALFGDTVNTAARMKSSSQNLRINCSDSAFKLIEKYSNRMGYKWEKFMKSMKGKGAMQCHLLEEHCIAPISEYRKKFKTHG